MTLSNNELHVYLRNIEEDERTSLSVLVGLIAEGAQVLDVGCGSGALGQYLQARKQCTVDGVTFNQAEAELARAYYRKVEVANLEETALTALFGDQRYDCIVCADVLEHLREPERLLENMTGLLSEQGHLLISIPNSNYAGLVAELLEGEFRYRQEGLLDATHVRHVTRRSLLRLLQEHGWQVQSFETIERALHESEFQQAFDQLPPAVARYLLATPDALTYQFIVAARPQADGADNSRFLGYAPEAGLDRAPLFSAQLYWDDGNGFSEAHKRVQTGAIGQQRQTLRFELPADLPALRHLKFDPADRPGILYLYALQLQAADGQILWRWEAQQSGHEGLLQAAVSHEMVWGGAVLGQGGVVPILLTGSDPWLRLPVPAEVLAQAAAQGPAAVVVELGWPMSADYVSLVNLFGPMQAEQQFLREQNAEKGRSIAHVHQEHEKLALEHAQLHRLHAELHSMRDQLQERFDQLHSAYGQLENEHGQLQSEHGQLQGARGQLQVSYDRLCQEHEHLQAELQALSEEWGQKMQLVQEQNNGLCSERDQLQAQWKDQLQELRDKLDLMQAESLRAIAEKEALQVETEGLRAQWGERLEAAEQQARSLAAEREQAQAQIADLQQHLRGMVDHYNNMRNSRVFRYTRPLVYARDVLKGRRSLFGSAGPAQAGAVAERESVQTPAEPLPVPPPLSETVDIIVPVYRGLADTQLCVESVLASEVDVPHRLIVINDCSPEPEVTEWLREKARNEPRILLLENEQNLGFVGTVNRGMRASTANDVLLLNSDTEVANDWLDRLRRAAYSHARAGSVTPFSSNATICSYPLFCKANPLPEGWTTASLDRLFAKTNAGQTVEVPTGVGFCMYIRRDCLDEVGFFDEENFGKGYGEENDFCQRAIQQGWSNLHALDTYVLHTGGVSFGESKSPREQAAMDTLRRLHPDYELQVHRFLQQDPARRARLAVDLLRHTDDGRKPVVLAVSHQRGGGTERHVLELAHTLAEQIVFVSLRPVGEHQVQLQLIEHDAANGCSLLSSQWSVVLDVEKQQEMLLQMLRAMAVAHVHYHHLLGHEQAIWELPQQLGVGYDFTAHDFYTFCTNITMTGRHGRYEVDAQGECCGGVHPPPMPPVEPDIQAWRQRNQRFLEGARFVLAPSLDTAQRIQRFAPQAPVRYAPHTDMDATAVPEPQPRLLAHDQPLRIVVIGALSVIKGADVLEQAAILAKKQKLPVEFHLIGFAYRHLQTQPASTLQVHGQYDEKDLAGLLRDLAPDLVWLPAQWPETYSYTLSAALQQGLPVAVPNLGAFAERVAGRSWSWVFPWDLTPEQWLARFAELREQHFATGHSPQPPVLAGQLADAQQRWGGWDYLQDYVPELPAPGSAGTAVPATLVAQIAAQAPSQPDAMRSPSWGVRQQVLDQLVRLRASPALRPIAKAIPPQWQARVKSWLQR